MKMKKKEENVKEINTFNQLSSKHINDNNYCQIKDVRCKDMEIHGELILEQKEILIQVQLNLGTASATAWGCDLSKEYVTINSKYMT